MVVARAPKFDGLTITGQRDVILHGPDALRRVGAGEDDLGCVTVVRRCCTIQTLRHGGHDLVTSLLHPALALQAVVLRQDFLLPRGPVLRVDAPGVEASEPFDLLEILQLLQPVLQTLELDCRLPCPTSLPFCAGCVPASGSRVSCARAYPTRLKRGVSVTMTDFLGTGAMTFRSVRAGPSRLTLGRPCCTARLSQRTRSPVLQSCCHEWAGS